MGTGVTGHLAWGGQRAGPLPFDSRSTYLFGAPELRKDSNVWGLAFPGVYCDGGRANFGGMGHGCQSARPWWGQRVKTSRGPGSMFGGREGFWTW